MGYTRSTNLQKEIWNCKVDTVLAEIMWYTLVERQKESKEEKFDGIKDFWGSWKSYTHACSGQIYFYTKRKGGRGAGGGGRGRKKKEAWQLGEAFVYFLTAVNNYEKKYDPPTQLSCRATFDLEEIYCRFHWCCCYLNVTRFSSCFKSQAFVSSTYLGHFGTSEEWIRKEI